jgi:hypothetical protein
LARVGDRAARLGEVRKIRSARNLTGHDCLLPLPVELMLGDAD